jgi:hypothetical protein
MLEYGTKLTDFEEIKVEVNLDFSGLYKQEEYIDIDQEGELIDHILDLISNPENNELSMHIKE